MLGHAIREFLTGDAGLTGLVGQRVHPVILPQGYALPAITYQWISQQAHHTLDGRVDLSRPRIQFDIYARTYLEVEAITDALRARLDGYKGQLGGSPGVYAQGAFLVTERDLFESEPELFRRSADYVLWVEQ